MGDFLQRELAHVKAKIGDIENTELITCVEVSVRVKISLTERKELTVCFHFPKEYPRKPILLEFKSNVMSYKLLDGLAKVMEDEAKKMIGQYQVVQIVKLIKKFMDDNPLCVCSEEISAIRKNFLGPNDEMKLKQKSSQVILKLKEKAYFINVKFTIPDDYPNELTTIDVTDTNFTDLIKANFATQCLEIARRCKEPPIRKKAKDPPFKPKAALQPITEYLVREIIRRYPHEICKLCGEICLPENPKNVTNEAGTDKFIVRVYCSDLFHYKCMDEYMKTPPFDGGKKCVNCGKRIYHDKWHISPELAEARWAHKEAKHRELNDVIDFFE